LAPKPSAGRRRQQPRSPEEGRPGGPRATVMRRRAVGRWVGGARLSVLVVGVDSGGGAVEAGRREEAERGSGSWEQVFFFYRPGQTVRLLFRSGLSVTGR
jgi:hypothetical protein